MFLILKKFIKSMFKSDKDFLIKQLQQENISLRADYNTLKVTYSFVLKELNRYKTRVEFKKRNKRVKFGEKCKSDILNYANDSLNKIDKLKINSNEIIDLKDKIENIITEIP